MKLRIWCDSGANIHSCREEIISIEDIGLTENEWNAMTDEQREAAAKEIAFSNLEWGFTVLP